MDKIILWCCLLLVPLNHAFFIRSKDLRRILNFFPTPSDVAVKPRRPFHHRYHHHHHHHLSNNNHHHHHDDDYNHRHYYNEDNHYHQHEDEIKPAPIKEDFYDEDYDYHHDRNDNLQNRRKHIKKPERNMEKQQVDHINCEHNQNIRQRTKKYKPKNTKPAKVVYRKKLQEDYEDNNEDYDEDDSIVEHRKNRKIIDNRRPFNFKQDYVAGVLATIPKIQDTDLSQEYFEHVKFNNPFTGTFTDNYDDIETQTELISKPFDFFDNL